MNNANADDCHACGLARELCYELSSCLDCSKTYVLCPNCLIALTSRALTPTEFNNLIATGHTQEEFWLKHSFYDKDGNALQAGLERN